MMIETEIKIDTERERETEKRANDDEQISAPLGLYLSEVTLSLYTFHISGEPIARSSCCVIKHHKSGWILVCLPETPLIFLARAG